MLLLNVLSAPMCPNIRGSGHLHARRRLRSVCFASSSSIFCWDRAVASSCRLVLVRMTKCVLSFGDGQTEGDASMKELLGGKGANLCEMVKLNLPIPPGFCISTHCCQFFSQQGKYPEEVRSNVEDALKLMEKRVGRKFGDANDPLLVSIQFKALHFWSGKSQSQCSEFKAPYF